MLDEAHVLADRLRGVAVGAAAGDALGMPLEFGPASRPGRLVRAMQAGRLPAGTFTDDTEMALALADALRESARGFRDSETAHAARAGLDPELLGERFAAWYDAGPADVGLQTSRVLAAIRDGATWEAAVSAAQWTDPDSAGNGSVMRCWPVAIACWDDLSRLRAESALQSRVTHPHPECVAGSVFVNVTIYHLLQGATPHEALSRAVQDEKMPDGLRAAILAAPRKQRADLANTGWVRHTIESGVWGLLTTRSFEEAVVQVVNLGHDADTAGAVVGALAGAAYGLGAIPPEWRAALRGEWPVRSGVRWDEAALVRLADELAGR